MPEVDGGRLTSIDRPGATPSRMPLRVLVVNFTLDTASPVLPWQAAVANAIARRVTSVHVLTEWLGVFEPEPNLTFVAMPHRPFGVPRPLGGLWLMLPKLISAIERFRPDVCFVHMAHEWCYRLGPWLRVRRIPVLLWYAHGSVPWKLHLSSAVASRIVTSTPEGFRIATPKRRIIGQAIDTEVFRIPATRRPGLEVVTVGRVSRRKNIALLIDAMARVVAHPGLERTRLTIVGPELTDDDRTYRRELDAQIAGLGLSDRVTITGGVEQAATAALYETAALHVNVSRTGSMDKTVMEALACGCPVLTSNEAFATELAEFPAMLMPDPTPETLAGRIGEWLDGTHHADPGTLRARIVGRHDLDGYADRIVTELSDLAPAPRRPFGPAR